MAAAVEVRTAPGRRARRRRRAEASAVLVAAVGLLVQAIGYWQGWEGAESAAVALWYIGFVGIVAPFAWLLVVPQRTDLQRLGAALAFSVIMYASWLLTSPFMAIRFDESLHVTTLVDLVEHQEFFYPNTTLPVSPHYPGLEFATAGVHWLTGLPLIACQILVVLIARVVFVLSLFLLASRIGHSTRVGGATVLLYGGSAQFYFFNAQYSYQTVAIAALMAALYLLLRAFDSERERPTWLLVGVQACLAALAITHHLTSWLMVVVLWLLAFFFWRGGEVRRTRLTVITAELGTIIVGMWTAVIAPLLAGYLGPIFNEAASEILHTIDGGQPATAITGGPPTPTWELMVMAGSIAVWVVMMVPAAWAAWRRGSLGRTRARYVPLIVAAIYPALQLARFAPSAAEVSDRASTFVTIAMALVVAVWLVPRLHHYTLVVVPGLVLLILGGTLIGSGPDWQRVTGPYLAGAEQRSVDAETIAVARWASAYLPADSRVAADSTFIRVLPNFAPITILTEPGGYERMTPVFLAHEIDDEVLGLIHNNDVDFIVVDTRLSGQTARSGCLFEASCGYGAHAQTVDPVQVTKFENQPGFDLVLDGPVRVYDVRPLRDVDQTFAQRPMQRLPGDWTPWQVIVTAALLLVGLLMRRRLIDPRRFTAGEAWRAAIILPVAMALGALGVVADFRPELAVLVVTVALGVLIWRTRQPAPLGAGSLGDWVWGAAIGVVLVAAAVLATWAAWHGLLDHPGLPAPTPGGES